jgi:DNA modification methylase
MTSESNTTLNYITGDIHDIIKSIDDNSIDFIYTDPPFGTTKSKWDKPLRWNELFLEMWRVLKPDGIICLYSSLPFTYELYKYETPKYHYSWCKNNKTGFFQAKHQPLRQMEEINIYYKKRGTYNPQMTGDKYVAKRNVMVGGRNAYYGEKLKDKVNEYVSADGDGHTGLYPTTFKNWDVRRDKSGITRTDDHIDYFIKTYTNENDTILDMTCHNNYVGDRCKILNRNYIGVDLEIKNNI